MPVVLTVSGFTESGHTYDDKLGTHYTFPAIYRSLIKPGETAVFDTDKRAHPEKARLSYLGTAFVGQISDATNLADGRTLLQCEFCLFQEIQVAVPFKLGEVYSESPENLHARPMLHFSSGGRKTYLGRFLPDLMHGREASQ